MGDLRESSDFQVNHTVTTTFWRDLLLHSTAVSTCEIGENGSEVRNQLNLRTMFSHVIWRRLVEKSPEHSELSDRGDEFVEADRLHDVRVHPEIIAPHEILFLTG